MIILGLSAFRIYIWFASPIVWEKIVDIYTDRQTYTPNLYIEIFRDISLSSMRDCGLPMNKNICRPTKTAAF